MINSRKSGMFRRVRDASTWAVCLIFLILPVACKEKTTPTLPPPKVTVVQPVKEMVTDYLELTGNTQATNTVQLVARVSGYLEKVFFQDGQIVKKGQLLFRIQQNTYDSRLQQAEGQILLQKSLLEYTQKELTRYSNLLEEKAAAQTDVDNWRNQRDSAQANLLTAEANRDLAKLDLSYTEVTAPFDGRIDRRLQDPGNMVGSGPNNTVLAELNQIDPIYVYFTISDLDLARLTKAAGGIPGQVSAKKWPVFIGLANEEGYPRQGYLDFAAISLTPTTGTLLMRGVFSNPAGKILPGLYARVRMPVEKKTAFLLPEESIAFDQQGDHVLIVNGKNLVERRNIKTGPLVDNLRAVEEGLAGEERVIVKGLQRAAPGRQVTLDQAGVMPPQGPSQPDRQKQGKS